MRIAVYAFDDVTMFHLSTPTLVFDEVARQGFADWSSTLFSEARGHVRTAEGYQLGGLADLTALEDADAVVIPSWHTDFRRPSPALIGALRRAHERGATVVGLCLGSIAVADAGLLDGRAAVTHWKAFETFRTRHPGVALDKTVLYIDHGDVLTSAGTAAGLDACLHLVRTRLGSHTAGQVAKELVVAPHRGGGQAQYIDGPRPSRTTAEPISRVLEWALEHLAEPIDVDTLAGVARMSRRTFIRAFTATNGTTPAAWLREQRLNEARRLLETTDLPIEQAAARCGLHNAATFRKHFRTSFGMTPSEYRRDYSTRHGDRPGPAGNAGP
ncbi:GlxA family transcriptional regulator [Nocardiopsis tropica]|uniref:Helix-turn-helix domain-containing protein n=1 Tax=Nocardiopsis tropica TaxID=109330 RepID=A0ABU7KP79_9ACTN|nr:helix-turn-helix domain-containing protein [Nocardiopsis umidischolae]MEE2051079.1 helix-turn-helix domain-containing protein [Nocardiopsis umidischolae]